MTDEKYKIYDNYMREIHGQRWGTSKDVNYFYLYFYFDFFQGCEDTWCQEPFASVPMGLKPIQIDQLDPDLQLVFREYKDLQENIENLSFGNKHLCFYINGKLVGVAVVDVCPSIICSLYFWYDPILKPLSFGKISVIKEIQFFQLLRNISLVNKNTDGNGYKFKYHNLGGFALGDGKVGYKAEFGPGQLLCPVTMKYAEVGYIDRNLNHAIDRAKQQDPRFKIETETLVEEEEGMQDEQTEQYIATLHKLLFDSPKMKLEDRKLFMGNNLSLDSSENDDFGKNCYFSDQEPSAKEELIVFIKEHGKLLAKGRIVQISDVPQERFDTIIGRYEWVFRAIGKRVIKQMLFKI